MNMVERAAKAMCREWGYNSEHDPEDDQTVAPDGDEITYCPRPSLRQFREATAAALLAALDPEDEALVAAMIAPLRPIMNVDHMRGILRRMREHMAAIYVSEGV